LIIKENMLFIAFCDALVQLNFNVAAMLVNPNGKLSELNIIKPGP
jgi:hypothetical protein